LVGIRHAQFLDQASLLDAHVCAHMRFPQGPRGRAVRDPDRISSFAPSQTFLEHQLYKPPNIAADVSTVGARGGELG
jgi:hypothetical protein